MKVCVNENLCIGCGMCVAACPEVFSLREEDNKAVANGELQDGVYAQIETAKMACPTGAIQLD